MRVVFASHGGLGCAMREAVAMILGVSVKEVTDCVELLEGESFENYYEKLASRVDGDTIVLADLFGGTPSKAALMLLQESKVKAVITGFNMAMVIQLLSSQDEDLESLVLGAKSAGMEGVRAFVGPGLRELTGKKEEGPSGKDF